MKETHEIRDNQEKLVMAKNGLVFAAGVVGPDDKSTTGNHHFQALHVLNQQFFNKPITDARIQEFNNLFSASLNDTFKDMQKWVSANSSSQYPFVEVGLVWITQGVPHYMILEYWYSQKPYPELFNLQSRICRPAALLKAEPYPMGRSYVENEVLEGHKRKFDNLRATQDAQRYLTVNAPDAAIVSTNDAKRVAQEIIRWENERETEITHEAESQTSKQSSCGLVSPSGEVHLIN